MSKIRSVMLASLPAALLLVLGASIAAAEHSKGNVDELRFGTAIDSKGEVPVSSHTSHFVPDATIHVTMRVEEAVQDSDLMLSILDRETEELVWSENQSVPGGHAVMHFVIDAGELAPGKYRAKVRLGPDWVAEHEFKVE
jgi:hypothetical protein